MKLLSSLARNRAADATSSGRPRRRSERSGLIKREVLHTKALAARKIRGRAVAGECPEAAEVTDEQ
jgi:hypothetical protein